jgi:vacuolar-type H+-ATPase subunit I/STV1
MQFAKTVFWVAGIWGILVLTPLYFIFDLIGRKDPPPITHPGFYYGFTGTALAWQVAFMIIATNPARFRPLMIAGILNKFSYAAALTVLYLQQRLRASDLTFGGVDLLLGVLFVIAYLKIGNLERISGTPKPLTSG